MSEADNTLRKLLANGPRPSREVLAVLAQHGITFKQARSARERLNLVVARTGNGEAMRSTWALPLPEQAPLPAGKQRAAKQPAEPAFEGGEALLPHEEALVVRRTHAFAARGGLSDHAARELATALVLGRDRVGERGGSCVECQNLVRPGVCAAAAAGHAEGPRELMEVWHCWVARRLYF